MTKIEAIAQDAGENLRRLICEAERQIQASIEETVNNANDNDAEAVLSISFGIKLNLDKNVCNYALGFSTRHKFESVSNIPDPNQIKLNLGGEQ